MSDENRSASSLSVPEYSSRRSVSPDMRSIRSLPMTPAPDSQEGKDQATIYEQVSIYVRVCTSTKTFSFHSQPVSNS